MGNFKNSCGRNFLGNQNPANRYSSKKIIIFGLSILTPFSGTSLGCFCCCCIWFVLLKVSYFLCIFLVPSLVANSAGDLVKIQV